MNCTPLRMFRMSLAALLLSFVLLPQPNYAEEKAPDELPRIFASILKGYGGKEAVTKVRSVIAKGTISDFMKNKEGEYARYYARPQKLRIEIMANQGGEVRVLDGMRGWQGNPNALKEARPISVQSMIYQYSYLNLPMGLAENRSTVTYVGKQDLKGRQVDLMIININGAPKLRVYVDAESGLIVRVASDFDMGMGASELSTEYEDFRTVGKVRFPFRLINYAGDMKLSVISLSDIQVNPDIPQELFSPNSGHNSK